LSWSKNQHIGRTIVITLFIINSSCCYTFNQTTQLYISQSTTFCLQYLLFRWNYVK